LCGDKVESIEIHIDTSALDRAFSSFPIEVEKEIRIGLKESANEIISQARTELNSHFKHGSGKAEQSIQVDESKSTSKSITVGLNAATAPYSVYLHQGTGMYGEGKGEYFVEPKTKKALHWVSGGDSFFSKGHYVKGIPAFPFLHIAANKCKEKIQSIMAERIGAAIRSAGL
jgi:HK97 gp10 family phage protein